MCYSDVMSSERQIFRVLQRLSLGDDALLGFTIVWKNSLCLLLGRVKRYRVSESAFLDVVSMSC